MVPLSQYQNFLILANSLSFRGTLIMIKYFLVGNCLQIPKIFQWAWYAHRGRSYGIQPHFYSLTSGGCLENCGYWAANRETDT